MKRGLSLLIQAEPQLTLVSAMACLRQLRHSCTSMQCWKRAVACNDQPRIMMCEALRVVNVQLNPVRCPSDRLDYTRFLSRRVAFQLGIAILSTQSTTFVSESWKSRAKDFPLLADFLRRFLAQGACFPLSVSCCPAFRVQLWNSLQPSKLCGASCCPGSFGERSWRQSAGIGSHYSTPSGGNNGIWIRLDRSNHNIDRLEWVVQHYRNVHLSRV